jgi:integrase
MASIEKRLDKDGKPHYRAKVRLKGSPPQSMTFTRLRDARHWVQSTESAIRDGRYVNTPEARRRTVSQMLDKYEIQVVPQKKSQKTQSGMLAWWRTALGHYTLADIRPALIADFRDQLLKETTSRGSQRSPATARKYLALLSHVFTVAVKEWGWIESNPVIKVTKPKEPRGRVRFLEDPERQALLEACRSSSNPYLYPVVLLAISTGMRRGEIMSLKWGDIKFADGVIIIHESKNDERRSVPLATSAKLALQRLSKIRRIDTGLLFPSKQNPTKPIDLRKAWETARSDSGVKDFRFHDLRHCTASYLAMNGATQLEIAEVLGHKTLQMVKRYSHLSKPHTHSVMASMTDRYLDDA